MSFSFQLFSDIHLEFFSQAKSPKIPPFAPFLFLAGDIGKINNENFKEFFDYCSSNWEKVFYVLGNHEYYHTHKTFDKLNLEYKSFFSENYTNIFLLDNSYFELHLPANGLRGSRGKEFNLMIIGTTLWSSPTLKSDLNDFSQIKTFNIEKNRKYGITLDEFHSLHSNSTDFLLETITNNPSTNIIIMSHFPPTQLNTSHPIYNNQPQPIKDYFASNIIDKIPDNHNIIGWLYGHTHFSNDFIHPKNIRLISNQCGYKEDLPFSNLNPDGLFTIDLK